VVLDRHGQLIEDWNHEGHYHVSLRLDQMGKYAPPATIAAEDRNFYSHGGVDIGSTLRALWVDVTTGGLNEGGSTITQQLVKIQLLTPQKSFERKLHEMVLAIALEQRFSKDQILTMYMNRVYYGHGAYGIGAAARTYFSKDAKDLTPAQAAFLAGLVQAPSAYNPQTHYDLAPERTSSLSSRSSRQRARARPRISSTTSWPSWSRLSARLRSSRAALSCTPRSTYPSSSPRTRRSRMA
jgi:penicillin-binding protein 1A